MELLRRAGVPAAPVLTVDAVMAEPQTRQSGVVVSAPHPRLPGYRSIVLPIEWNGTRPAVRRVPPALGEHTDEVLAWLGYGGDEIAGLRSGIRAARAT